MKPIGTHNYFVYILTNKNKTVIYTGVTNDIQRRLFEHKDKEYANKHRFTWKYNCFYLVHIEHFQWIEDAISREKQIKGWNRKKKIELIESENPDWNFLNNDEF